MKTVNDQNANVDVKKGRLRNGKEMSKSKTAPESFSDEALKDKIGDSLKRMYDDVVNEPIPDDFLNLLKQADQRREQ